MSRHAVLSVGGVFNKSVVLAVLACLVAASGARADRCKSPKVVITNKSTRAYKIKRFDYKDGCDNQWRSESVEDRVVGAGESITYRDDLEYVGNCRVPKLRIDVEVDIANDFKAGINEQRTLDVVEHDGEKPRCNTNHKLEYIIES